MTKFFVLIPRYQSRCPWKWSCPYAPHKGVCFNGGLPPSIFKHATSRVVSYIVQDIVWNLWCLMFVMSHVCDITCLWCHMFVVSHYFDVTCLWYHVILMSHVCDITFFDVTYLWYHLFVMSHVCDITCLWCRMFVVSHVCDVTCLMTKCVGLGS